MGKRKTAYVIILENSKKIFHFEDLDVERKTILK
jgi:hypothetical protein